MSEKRGRAACMQEHDGFSGVNQSTSDVVDQAGERLARIYGIEKNGFGVSEQRDRLYIPHTRNPIAGADIRLVGNEIFLAHGPWRVQQGTCLIGNPQGPLRLLGLTATYGDTVDFKGSAIHLGPENEAGLGPPGSARVVESAGGLPEGKELFHEFKGARDIAEDTDGARAPYGDDVGPLTASPEVPSHRGDLCLLIFGDSHLGVHAGRDEMNVSTEQPVEQ